MIYTMLKKVKEKGYNIAVLNSSKMGQGIYKNIGFKEYSNQSIYMWINM